MGWIAAGFSLGKKLALDRQGPPFLDSTPGYWGEHWKYSKWVLWTAFVFQFTTQGYYWLVAGFLSVKQVAELKAIYLFVQPVDHIFIAMSYLVLPMLASHYAARKVGDLRSLWKRYTFATTGVTALFALAVRIAGRPTMHWLYAGRFDGLAPLLYMLAFLPLLMGIGNSTSIALNAAEKPKVNFYAYVCSGAVTFLGGIPLVMHFGLAGAIYGMLLSATAYTITLAVGFFSCVHLKASQ